MPRRFTTWEAYLLPKQPGQSESDRVLRNKLGATTADTLAAQELLITARAVAVLESTPHGGPFDFAHHQDIHRRIFREVYEWAGQPRTVDMGKTHRLCPAALIESMAADVYSAVGKENNLVGLDHERFVARLAEHWGEVNVVHAFREGNTRSQRVFFAQLCDNAGYTLSGPYLEAHYAEFNIARESAMLTARSDQFAAFLTAAVVTKDFAQPSDPPVAAPGVRVDVEQSAPRETGDGPTARRDDRLPGRGQWGFSAPSARVLDAAATAAADAPYGAAVGIDLPPAGGTDHGVG